MKKYPKIVKRIKRRVAAFNLRSSDKSPIGSISRMRCSLNKISNFQNKDLYFLKPLGFFDYIKLMKNSFSWKMFRNKFKLIQNDFTEAF